MPKQRTTDQSITSLKKGEVFVFGSNLSGRHGKGAALQALEWGAIIGLGEGPYGNTYAIPTKDNKLKTLPIKDIKACISRFERFAKNHPEKTFLVTEIGCGLAGYMPKDIAPLFAGCIDVKNVHFPERFWSILSLYVKFELP
jgi:hypothetical protein